MSCFAFLLKCCGKESSCEDKLQKEIQSLREKIASAHRSEPRLNSQLQIKEDQLRAHREHTKALFDSMLVG